MVYYRKAPRRCPRRIAPGAGLTFAELIVVIAIIAVLVAALLPVLFRARSRTMRVNPLPSVQPPPTGRSG